MENPAVEKLIKKNALNGGLLLGAVSCVLGIFSFYFMTSMTTSFWAMITVPMLFSMIVPLILAVFISLDMRKKIGGYWSFKQATTAIFIMFIVSYIVSGIIVNGLFVRVIEPNMIEKTKTAMVDATGAMMEKSGADQAKIDKQTAEVEKKFDEQKNTTIGKTIQSIAINIVLLFVLALIFGAIFKKDPPLFDVIDNQEPETTV